MTGLHPVLNDFANQFSDIKVRAKNIFDDLSEKEFNVKPDPNKWSAGECIEHLNVTGRLYLSRIYKSIRNAVHINNKTNNYKHRWLYEKSILGLEPPYKRKIKTFPVFVPTSSVDFKNTVSIFIELQDRFIKSLEDANNVNWQKCKIRSPATNIIKLKLGEAYLLLAVHERRHLWQAEQNLKNF